MIPQGRLLRRITSLAGVYSAPGRNALSSPIAPGSGPGLGSCFPSVRGFHATLDGTIALSVPDNTRLVPEIRRPLLTAFGSLAVLFDLKRERRLQHGAAVLITDLDPHALT